jgi:hypothetical protein
VGEQGKLFPDLSKAHARNTDPETSHRAAEGILRLTERRAAVLETLRRIGPATDERLAMAYRGIPQSPSGLRTRRSELCRMGLVRPTGRRGFMTTGNMADIYEAVE